ncbi:PTS IIA-like nitrogen-regulatory protein PtsN [Betaproteobacteria bacterium]|nr:PTS IIA-like nitrogen-regulatory protein PtsN [Betaproteobacteria bacterium]
MSLIPTLLAPARVIGNFDASSKKRVFEQAALLFEEQIQISRDLVFEKLFSRERLGSTGLGQGVAIPHARIAELKEASGAFIRLITPIPFDAPDGRPVSLVFVLLVPEEANDAHLRLLADLAQMFSDRSFREQLASATDDLALYALLNNWQASGA